MEGNLQNMTEEQAASMALSFVRTLGNAQMTDRDVFYAGIQAYMAISQTSQPTFAEFNVAYQRLAKLAR